MASTNGKTGTEGGCLATVTSTEALVTEAQQQHRQPLPEATAWAMAREDLRQMKARVWRMKLWRTWPDWSMPAELLRITLHPEWINPRRPKPTRGLGCDTEFSRYGVVVWALTFLLYAYRRWRRRPVQLRKAQGSRISKRQL